MPTRPVINLNYKEERTIPQKPGTLVQDINTGELSYPYLYGETTVTAPNKSLASKVSKGISNAWPVAFGVPLAPLIAAPSIGAAATSPLVFAGGMLGGLAGDVITNKTVKTLSNNKYKSWGNFIEDKTGLPETLGAFTNPGAILGGGLGSIIGLKLPNASFYQNIRMSPRPKVNTELTSHLQGDDAVKMFKDYKGDSNIESGLMNRIRRYVPEARERYGLVGNQNITDDEIAGSLYKQMLQMQKQTNSANITSSGEPRVVFRGDTRRYETMRDKITPEELSRPGETDTMDNSLGSLFLGDLPSTNKGVGIDRYITTQRTGRFIGIHPSGTGSKIIVPPETYIKEATPLVDYQTRFGDYSISKVPGKYNKSGINDINAYFINTKNVRDATDEISVLGDDFLSNQRWYKGVIGDESRESMAKHYRAVLDEAKANNEGLLKSKSNSRFRDEHERYDYFAVPNWNKEGIKHILPYDLRIPRNWNDPNIYRTLLPFGMALPTLLDKKKCGGVLLPRNKSK